MNHLESFVAAVIARIPEPYPFNITDQVFLEIEGDEILTSEYVRLTPANHQIGKMVKEITGGKPAMDDAAAHAKRIKTYSLLLPAKTTCATHPNLCAFYRAGTKYQYARRLLPILIDRARNGERVFYKKDLMERGGFSRGHLGLGLRVMAEALQDLGHIWEKRIPYLQTLAVSITDNLPKGEMEYSLGCETYAGLHRQEKESKVAEWQQEVYDFDSWTEVAHIMGLRAWSGRYKEPTGRSMQGGGGGEGQAHKNLKDHLANHPELIGQGLTFVRKEYPLLSGDSIDLMFTNEHDDWIGVEVKSDISKWEDIERGLFQCVKYEAVLMAIDRCQRVRRNVRMVLAIGGSFPKEIFETWNTLGYEVIGNLQPVGS